MRKGAHFKAELPAATVVSGNPVRGLDVCAAAMLAVYLADAFYFIYNRPVIGVISTVLLGLVAIVGLWRWLRRLQSQDRLPSVWRAVFPAVLVTSGLLFALLFTPYSVPDEKYHYSKSYILANYLLYGEDGRYDMRVEDYLFTKDPEVFHKYMDSASWDNVGERFTVFARHTGVVRDRVLLASLDIGANGPQLKLPSALGICLGRVLNLGAIPTYYLGRVFNLLFAAFLITLAVRLTPLGKHAVMVASMLPMTLHLLASYSYDGCTIAYAFLLLALLLRMIVGEGRLRRRELVAGIVVSAALAPCKVIYAPMTVLALFVPSNRFRSRRAMLLWKASMLLVPLVCILALRLASLVKLSGVAPGSATALKSRDTEKGIKYSLPYIVRHPLATLSKLVYTMRMMSLGYIWEMMGGPLGWFQYELDLTQGQYLSLFVLLGCACVRSADDMGVLDIRVRAVCLAAFAIAFAGSVASMLLGWTFVTDPMVMGVQGRYLTPALPCLLVAFRGRSFECHTPMGPVLLFATGSLVWLLSAQIVFSVLGAVPA